MVLAWNVLERVILPPTSSMELLQLGFGKKKFTRVWQLMHTPMSRGGVLGHTHIETNKLGACLGICAPTNAHSHTRTHSDIGPGTVGMLSLQA